MPDRNQTVFPVESWVGVPLKTAKWSYPKPGESKKNCKEVERRKFGCKAK